MRIMTFFQLFVFATTANAYMPGGQDMFLLASLVIFWLIGLGRILFIRSNIKNKIKSFLLLLSGLIASYLISHLFDKLELSEAAYNIIFFIFNLSGFVIAGRVLKNND